MKTATKPKGLIFTVESVRAILANRKTQTRRVVKPQPSPVGDNGGKFLEVVPTIWPGNFDFRYELDNPRGMTAPHKVGDLVYAKETWLELRPGHLQSRSPRGELIPRCSLVNRRWVPGVNGISYRADCVDPESERCREELGYKWRSPMLMPRWAARLWLRITAVRCERVQEISEADAFAEGVEIPSHLRWKPGPQTYENELRNEARLGYMHTWDAINGNTYRWVSNPWVWVYTFEKTEKPE